MWFGRKRETYAHETDEFVVANGFVRFVVGWRAFRAASVAIGRVTTSVIVATLETVSGLARFRTTRTLRRECKGYFFSYGWFTIYQVPVFVDSSLYTSITTELKAESLTQFLLKLKTHLFKSAFKLLLNKWNTCFPIWIHFYCILKCHFSKEALHINLYFCKHFSYC